MIIGVLLSGLARAGPFEDGAAAHDRGDYATALKLWRPLAAQSVAEAQFNLGVLYRQGEGVPQDDAEAVKWYRLAADQGLAAAQDSLGFMYDNGHGVPKDYSKAVKWYRLAAAQDDADAQLLLGYMYDLGYGVPQDYVLAYMWFNLAAAQGYQDAAANRYLVAETMTPDQIAEAQRMAREWKPTPRP